MNNGIKKLQDYMIKHALDGFLVGSEANRMYISGFTGSSAMLLITPKAQYLVTDFRYLEQVQKQCPDFECIDQKGQSLIQATLKLAHQLNLRRIGFEGETTSYTTYQTLREDKAFEFIGTVGVIAGFRQIKSQEELEKLEKAEAIGDFAFNEIVKYIKEHWQEGVTEREIALQIECIMRRQGASGISFDTIVASGAKSSLPHAVPEDKCLEKGDFVVMDFGCKYQGYCSDMTRTLIIGTPSEQQKEIYETVLEAQCLAIKGIRPGVKGKEIDALARDYIKAKGYGAYFGHGLGHSVGLEIHENPRFSPAEEEIIQEGMVITVEPGIYMPDFGGVRIEDLVIVTQEGVKNLTHSPKHLIIID